MEKKLYRSNSNKVLFGVCGGLGEYFNVDPTLVRVAAVVGCCVAGISIIAYIIAAIVMPENPGC